VIAQSTEPTQVGATIAHVNEPRLITPDSPKAGDTSSNAQDLTVQAVKVTTHTIHLTWFQSLTNPIGKAAECSIEELARVLKKQRQVENKKDAKLISGTLFQEGSPRGIKSALETHLLLLDIDNANAGGHKVTPVQIQEVAESLKVAGVKAFLATSFSHKPAVPRFRVVIPLLSPVPAKTWSRFAKAAIQHLGLAPFERGMDMGALKDVAKVYFLPSCPMGGQVEFVAVEGNIFDPARVSIDPGVAHESSHSSSARSAEVGPDMSNGFTRYKGDLRTLDIFTLLHDQGHDLFENAAGFHYFNCPWEEQHSHPGGQSAWVFKKPNHLPKFKCWHDACSERTLVDLLGGFDPEDVDANCVNVFDAQVPYDPDDSGKPRIVVEFDLAGVVDQCIGVLSESGLVFRRGDVLVDVPGFSNSFSGGNSELQDASYRIRAVPDGRIMEILSSGASFWHYKEDGKIKRITPPAPAIKALLARGHFALASLRGLTSIPVMFKPGKVLTVPGYDPESQLLYLPNHGPLTLLEALTLEDAMAALQRLLDPVQDFPFEAEVDKAAFMAAFLTPFARPAIQGPVPFFLVMGNIRSAGKGKLVDVIGQTLLSHSIPALAHTPDPKEEQQQIFSVALAGEQVVLLDNIEGKIGSPAFNSMLTATTVQGRIFHSQQLRSAPMNAVWYGTGNNPILHADLPRRTIFIQLKTDLERPELRTGFRYVDLMGHIHSIRDQSIADCLTILRAFTLAGSPRQLVQAMGSYEAWDRLIREAVFWVMGLDPCERTLGGECRHDPERDALEVLVRTWQAVFPGSGGHHTSEMAERVQQHEIQFGGFISAIRELSPKVDRVDLIQNFAQVLGYVLRRYQNRVILEQRFIRIGGKDRNGVSWALVPIDPTSC
jgi:putative DNA primase/helicase